MKKILSLLMLALVSIGTAWADSESSGNIGSSNVSWNGKSMSLDGKYIAGKGGVKQGNMPDKGVKMRSNQGDLVFKVNAGYKVTGFKFYGCGNTADAVTITSATVDGGSNLLAADVVLPGKGDSKSGDIELSGLAAKDNITLTFAEGSSAQIVGTWTIEYVQEEVIVQEITGVTLNGTAISDEQLATLKAEKALSIDGSSLNGIGMVDVTLSSGATTVTKSIADGTATYSFTINSTEAYTVTVNNITGTYTEQGTVVYYSKDGTEVEGAEGKSVTANGITFTMVEDKTFQSGTGNVTMGETKYVPLKLSTGSAVNVTFPEGKVATKAIVYGWSVNGNGKLSVFKESSDAEAKSVDVTGDVYYATNLAADIYPSVYEYTLDNWESLYFSAGGSASQPFILIDFVLADKPAPATSATVTVPATITDGTYYYTTFSSDKALDFTGVEGITAYTGVKKADGMLRLTEVATIPANTGVIIKAENAKAYTVPFVEGDVEAPATNDLIAAVETVNSSTVTNAYVLNGYEETFMGSFLFFREIGSVATDIPAGTAYLSLTDDENDEAYGYVYVEFPSAPGETSVAANIAELKALTQSATVELTLTNAQVTFSKYDEESGVDAFVLNDATGAVVIKNSEVSQYLTAGMVLTGKMTVNLQVVDYSMLGGGIAKGYSLDPVSAQDIAYATIGMGTNVAIAEGTAEPTEVTEENFLDLIYDYDWRYVKFADAVYSSSNQSLTFLEALESRLSDDFKVITDESMFTDGATFDVVGFLNDNPLAEQPVFTPVIITPKSAASTVAVAIGADGYTTFSSDKALDFSGSGLTAYVATTTATGDITFKAVEQVPANTGLLLQGAQGEAQVKVVDGGALGKPANSLVAVSADMTGAQLQAAGAYILFKGSKGLGFYKAGAGSSLKAGKAYLTAPAGARIFLPGGEATAISTVEAADDDAPVYNLQGQRVVKAAKGLNISNGKKFIVR